MFSFAKSKSLLFFERQLFCFFVLGTFISCHIAESASQDVPMPKDENFFGPPPTHWQSIPVERRIETLRFLVMTLQNADNQVQSFSANCSLQYEQGLSTAVAKSIHVRDELITGNMFQKINSLFTIASDRTAHKTFRSHRIQEQAFFSNGQKIDVQNAASVDTNSILTASEYLFSVDKEILPTVPELPGFPDAENRRTAWREPPEKSKNRGLFDMVDPCEHLTWGGWTALPICLEALEGKHGKKAKELMENICLFSAFDEKKQQWFRLNQLWKGSDEIIDLDIFWNQEAGFLPVCQMQTNGQHRLISLKQVRWKKVDQIFFPVEMSAAVFPNGDGKLSYRRNMSVNEMEVNKPIDSKVFSYSALGLGDGDVLVDRIKQRIYTIQDDKPVFLAKFYEKPMTSSERTISYVRIGLVVTGALFIILGIYLKIKRKREARSQRKENLSSNNS
jgi:hypothetical protein